MAIRPVRRFSSGINTLTLLTKSQTPHLRFVIPKYIATDLYEFLDASGSGYGRTLQLPHNYGSNPESIMQIWASL